jgi:hypothetical protein
MYTTQLQGKVQAKVQLVRSWRHEHQQQQQRGSSAAQV